MEGDKIYSAAIILTDRHDSRFQDMLTADSKESVIERKFFIDEFSDFPVMGWNEFCSKMVEAGQQEWLNKILRLDEEVLLSTMERRLLTATETGKVDKELLDSTVKALTGLVGRSKILSEQRGAQIANNEIIIKILPSKTDADVPNGNAEKLAREGSDGGRT